MTEIWKDVVGYEGLYQVSNLGRVKSVKRNKILSQKHNWDGYLRIQLWRNNKNKYVSIQLQVVISGGLLDVVCGHGSFCL